MTPRRRLRAVAGRLVGRGGGPSPAPDGEDRSYQGWVARYDTPDEGWRRAVEQRLEGLADPPTVSVLLPVFDTPEPFLRAAIDSALGQWYPRLELCVADDASDAPWVGAVLGEYARADERVRVVRRDRRGHISACANSALGLATGQWVAPLDHDDVLAPHALATMVLALADQAPPPGGGAGVGMAYSDEDHLDEEGARVVPYFKGEPDPLLLLGQNYLAHLCLLRRDLVVQAGGYREGLEGAQDWDLVLRLWEELGPAGVLHVPHVLYHWRAHQASTASSSSAKPYAVEAGRRAVEEHLARTGRPAAVRTTGPTGFNRILWHLPTRPPTVSVVMVARTTDHPLRRAVLSVLARTTYPLVEVVVVETAGGPDVAGALAGLLGQVTVVPPPSPGRTPAATEVELPYGASPVGERGNAGAAAASGEVLCFLHDDVEVLADRWLEELVGLALQPGVGAVGGTLVAPEGTVRHAGYLLGAGGWVHDAFRGLDRLDDGSFGRARLARRVAAVSGAALAVRRDAFEAVGGFSPRPWPAVVVDVDFCLRLAGHGCLTAVAPAAELVHHEVPVPGAPPGDRPLGSACYPSAPWAAGWGADPFSNPNLCPDASLTPAWPPRVTSPGWPAEVGGPGAPDGQEAPAPAASRPS